MNTRTAEESWLILTRRYGSDVREPSPAAIADAVSELYGNTADVEHGDMWLRYVLPDGRMVVLTATVSGTVTLEEYTDQDFSRRLSRRIRERVTHAETERLFQMLRERHLTNLCGEPWVDAGVR